MAGGRWLMDSCGQGMVICSKRVSEASEVRWNRFAAIALRSWRGRWVREVWFFNVEDFVVVLVGEGNSSESEYAARNRPDMGLRLGSLSPEDSRGCRTRVSSDQK